MPPRHSAVSGILVFCGCELGRPRCGSPRLPQVTVRHALAEGDSPADKKIYWFKITIASQVNPLPSWA
jgi:hypothetical protein